MPRVHVTVSNLIINHGDEIIALKEKGVTVTDLIEKYKCSRNTMVRCLGQLGFEVAEWTEKDYYKKKDK